ncbi:MAG: hypothetical protein Fur002_03960 [Anaerolineales bacterium]
MEQTKYKAEIDGLRALAVLSVLLYHLDVSAFSGGYVGVDIFFVISGFLITRLIRDEVLKSGRFNFVNFYLRRARRLLPAFLFTLAACFIVAFFLFPPPQMQDFSHSLFYSQFSLANVYFWRQSGYFDSASVYKPLLHIWSLSVEEQFYLVWPLLIVWLTLKSPRRAAPLVIFAALSVSLWMNIAFGDGQVSLLRAALPAAATWFEEGAATIFYLTPFRIFELSIGALLVWGIERQPKNKFWLEPLALAGFAFSIFPMLAYNDKTLFPSYNALLPCIGAALLLYAGEARYSGIVLRAPLVVEVGKISYSLYLVHWAAIVFYKYFIYDFSALSAVEQISIAVGAALMARFMYLYVEQPFRKSAGRQPAVSSKKFLIAAATLTFALAALSWSAWSNDGWAWRMPNSLTAEQVAAGKKLQSAQQSKCSILKLDADKCQPNAPMQVLFIGDSHYYVGYNMFAALVGGDKDVNLISFSEINKCGFAIQGERLNALGSGKIGKSRCQERADVLNDSAFQRTLDVLVVSSQTVFQKGAELPIVEFLASKNKALRVIIIGPYIDLRPYECADIINRFGSSAFCKDERFVSDFGGDAPNAPYYRAFMQYQPLYINTVEMLCKDGALKNCVTEADGAPMFYDSNHPSLEFSLLMGRRMAEVYSRELEQMGFAIGK